MLKILSVGSVAFNFLLILTFRKFIVFWKKKVRNNRSALQMEKMRREKREKGQIHMLLRMKQRRICYPWKKKKKGKVQGKLSIGTLRH